MRKQWSGMVAIVCAAAALVLCCAAALADDVTLSVQTADGLVVLHADEAEMPEIRDALAREFTHGADGADLLAFVYGRWSANAVRAAMYTSSKPRNGTPANEVNAEPLRTTVRDAVRRGLVPAIEGKPLYEAYMLAFMRGDTLLLLGEPPAGAPPVEHSVFVFSSSWGAGMCGVFVDGRDLLHDLTNGAGPVPGYNLIAMSPDFSNAQYMGFKTFENPEDGVRMQEFLNAQPDGAILLGTVMWGPGVYLSGGAVDALRAYGSTTDPDPQILSSHAVIGRKGGAPGTAAEASAVNAPAEVLLFGADFYIDEKQLEKLRPQAGSRIIAISGTAPDDTAVIIGGAK